MESRRYPTDLSDDEWRCISSHLPEPTGQGRPRLHSLRAILDAVFYVLKSGCPWRLLPRDFPPWKTVYDWFRKWRIDGTWERLNAELRKRLRARLGRNPQPSAAIVDSQSVRTTGVGGKERGFDPAKKVEGRKRHLLVDTEGLVLEARVHNAIRYPTKMASSCCWSRRAIAFLTSCTCGSMLATKVGAEGGLRKF
jgi:putative transposase